MSGRDLMPDALAALGDGSGTDERMCIGELVGISADAVRTPLVCYEVEGRKRSSRARSTVALRDDQVGASVVLLLPREAAASPILLGVVRPEGQQGDEPGGEHLEVQADGERLIVSARQQLVLRCGKASITLTRSGKVLIRGEHVSSRATGLNRIKGGRVDIN